MNQWSYCLWAMGALLQACTPQAKAPSTLAAGHMPYRVDVCDETPHCIPAAHCEGVIHQYRLNFVAHLDELPENNAVDSIQVHFTFEGNICSDIQTGCFSITSLQNDFSPTSKFVLPDPTNPNVGTLVLGLPPKNAVGMAEATVAGGLVVVVIEVSPGGPDPDFFDFRVDSAKVHLEDETWQSLDIHLNPQLGGPGCDIQWGNK